MRLGLLSVKIVRIIMLKDTQCEFFADRALKYKEATRRSKDVW